MDTISGAQAPGSKDGNTPFSVKVGLVASAVMMGILLTYYVGSPPLPLHAFSLLATWVAWQDVRGRIVDDSLLAAIFSLLAFGCHRGRPTEFLLCFLMLYSMATLTECFSTGYTKSGKDTEFLPLYYGRSGYLVGWMQASFLLLSAYMLLPFQVPWAFLAVRGGWDALAGTPGVFIPLMILVFCAVAFLYRWRIKSMEDALRKDGGKGWERRSNMRPQTAWFVASFGALLGFPLSLGVLALSFLVYLPFYLRKRACGAGEWHPAKTVRFPFLARIEKGK